MVGQVKLFDFGGMDKRHLPFREIEPEEGNVVVSINYSGSGHAFLVCTAGSQPKVGASRSLMSGDVSVKGKRVPVKGEGPGVPH